MELFNRTFFRFAFGFIGIIMFSVGIIFVVSRIQDSRKHADCPAACAKAR